MYLEVPAQLPTDTSRPTRRPRPSCHGSCCLACEKQAPRLLAVCNHPIPPLVPSCRWRVGDKITYQQLFCSRGLMGRASGSYADVSQAALHSRRKNSQEHHSASPNVYTCRSSRQLPAPRRAAAEGAEKGSSLTGCSGLARVGEKCPPAGLRGLVRTRKPITQGSKRPLSRPNDYCLARMWQETKVPKALGLATAVAPWGPRGRGVNCHCLVHLQVLLFWAAGLRLRGGDGHA